MPKVIKINKRQWLHWLSITAIITLGGVFLLTLIGYIYLAWFLHLPDSLDLRPRHISSKILDRNGNLLYEVLSPEQGRKTYVKLEENPYRRPLVQDKYLAMKGYRSINVKNYTLFYRIVEENNTVLLVRFMYSQRDWASILTNEIV